MRKKKISGFILLFTAVFLASGTLLSQPIPSSVLFSYPQRDEIRLSPDGEKVSYIGYDNNRIRNIFIKTIGKNDDRFIIEDLENEIISYNWSFMPEKILFFKKTEDKKAVHLYLTDISTKLIRDLTPFKGINAGFLITDHRKPEEVVCGIELNKKGRYDLYSVNLITGAITEVAKVPDDTIAVKGDISNRIFITESIDRKSLKRIFRIKTDKSDKFSELTTADTTEDFRIIDFSDDGKSLYLLSDKTNRFTALVRFDLESRKETETIAVSQKSDADNVFFNHYTKKPVSVAYDFMKRDITVIDNEFSEDFQILSKAKKGNITFLSNDLKNEKWLIMFETPEMPASYYVYNRTQKRTVLLFLSNPEFEKYKSVKSQPFTIKFGENEKLLLFVTLPADQNAENFPTILNLVNTKDYRKGIGFDPVCQFFSSRGFACIAFNHSGIRGFGKEFYNNAYSKDGMKRRTDEITTVIKWAIDRNIANPQQITILSDSLSSLYALNSVSENKDIIHTAVFIDPVLNIKQLRENFDITDFSKIKEILMVPSEDKKAVLSKFGQITVPSLFLLSKKSAFYDYNEIAGLLSDAKKKNKDIMMILYPEINSENTADFYQRTENFLAKYFNTDFIEMNTNSKSNAEIR